MKLQATAAECTYHLSCQLVHLQSFSLTILLSEKCSGLGFPTGTWQSRDLNLAYRDQRDSPIYTAMVGLLATNQPSIVVFCQCRNQSHLDNHKRLGYWNYSLAEAKDCNGTVLLTLHENIPKLLTRITTHYTVYPGAISRWKIAAEQYYCSVQFIPWLTNIWSEHWQAMYSLHHKDTLAEFKGTAVSSRLGAHLPFPHLPQVHIEGVLQTWQIVHQILSLRLTECAVYDYTAGLARLQ